jgi:hypothetical protein
MLGKLSRYWCRDDILVQPAEPVSDFGEQATTLFCGNRLLGRLSSRTDRTAEHITFAVLALFSL